MRIGKRDFLHGVAATVVGLHAGVAAAQTRPLKIGLLLPMTARSGR